VPRQAYSEAVLGVYELTKIDLLKDVFIWAYERSATRYAAVRQSLGEPDPFRLRYRDQLRDLIADLVRARVGRTELISLHEGNFARYRIRPSEFAAWRQIWEAR
jgi:hypothetical protein